MEPPASDLLQPSLSAHTLRRAPYSHQACFFTSFFGGPVASLGISALNGHRIGRLPRDLAWLVPLLLLWLAAEWAWQRTVSGQQFNAWLLDHLGESGPRYAERALALLLFACSTWVHRREHRAADLMGLARPNGWGPGLLLIVAGSAATWFLKQAMQS
jgi:hypothetical protein